MLRFGVVGVVVVSSFRGVVEERTGVLVVSSSRGVVVEGPGVLPVSSSRGVVGVLTGVLVVSLGVVEETGVELEGRKGVLVLVKVGVTRVLEEGVVEAAAGLEGVGVDSTTTSVLGVWLDSGEVEGVSMTGDSVADMSLL